MDKEEYCIAIQGKQMVNGEANEITINTLGSYAKEGDVRYITYREYDEDNPQESHFAVLQVEPGKVTVIHKDSETRLILEEGKRHLCLYDTGFGSMTLGIFTSELESKLEDNGGRLNIKYNIDIDSVHSSSNEIAVQVTRDTEFNTSQNKFV